jgi:selenium metabolism protein YedF
MKPIDCRGLACPAPVLTVKNAIEAEDLNKITLLVDNEAAKQNVSRFLSSQHFQVKVEEKEGEFLILGERGEGNPPGEAAPEQKAESAEKKIMVLVGTDRVGHGDDELGAKLMVSFLKTLKEMGQDLWRLVFVNNGVKLTIENSEVLPILSHLEEQGVTILVCGTCLTHFGLMEGKRVGETTNMLDIVTAMQIADSVVNI